MVIQIEWLRDHAARCPEDQDTIARIGPFIVDTATVIQAHLYYAALDGTDKDAIRQWGEAGSRLHRLVRPPTTLDSPDIPET